MWGDRASPWSRAGWARASPSPHRRAARAAALYGSITRDREDAERRGRHDGEPAADLGIIPEPSFEGPLGDSGGDVRRARAERQHRPVVCEPNRLDRLLCDSDRDRDELGDDVAVRPLLRSSKDCSRGGSSTSSRSTRRSRWRRSRSRACSTTSDPTPAARCNQCRGAIVLRCRGRRLQPTAGQQRDRRSPTSRSRADGAERGAGRDDDHVNLTATIENHGNAAAPEAQVEITPPWDSSASGVVRPLTVAGHGRGAGRAVRAVQEFGGRPSRSRSSSIRTVAFRKTASKRIAVELRRRDPGPRRAADRSGHSDLAADRDDRTRTPTTKHSRIVPPITPDPGPDPWLPSHIGVIVLVLLVHARALGRDGAAIVESRPSDSRREREHVPVDVDFGQSRVDSTRSYRSPSASIR